MSFNGRRSFWHGIRTSSAGGRKIALIFPISTRMDIPDGSVLFFVVFSNVVAVDAAHYLQLTLSGAGVQTTHHRVFGGQWGSSLFAVSCTKRRFRVQ
ncbi:uncharacterized protein [Physcomitrium patens]|uniref:uncharacterized protein isoform X4 n=1 Tax=Physcomitrium patens TaxID=3218 RepID=UPI003CCD6972